MPKDTLIAFLTVTLLLSASPGPVMINSMTDAAHYGLKKSIPGMLGVSLGNVLLITLSAFGMAVILQQYPDAMIWLQGVGGLYLVYLGMQLFRKQTTSLQVPASTDLRLDLKGFLIAVTNPKGIIYFAALLPQFVQTDASLIHQYILLTILVVLIDLVWMMIYAVSGKTIMGWIKSSLHQKRFNQITGSVLIMTGIGLGLIH